MTGDGEYSLVLPFVSVTSKGGPHDDASYVAGFEMGALDATLKVKRPSALEQQIHADNVDQADLIAMRHGYRCAVTDLGAQGWRFIELTRMSDRPRADLHRSTRVLVWLTVALGLASAAIFWYVFAGGGR